ncbi:DUF6046 domain-containing protein [Maribacter sp. ACAM166]|uniref:DUF6046 domain-containing protein n=1 Tax=Maribacter sp. ACAM166 TaxID=2508996 RepID=UPI0010FDD567|nr:DUF6046 domain-containing protein [Maribacter sp. ACAM166]TLP81354.1 hypothetical protein ES765_04930 [Maribacter sp. ACAM166]
MADYNINTLFEIAFGIKNYAMYRPEGVGSLPNAPGFVYNNIDFIESLEETARVSYMGTPIVFPIKFRGENYKFYNSNGEIENFPVADFDLPSATLVNFRHPKIVSKTTALASNGTVKEMYGFDDWVVDIRGICLRDPGHATAKTAYEQHQKLIEFDEVADSITVIGDLFTDKNISKLTILETEFKQVQGKPGVIPFYMRCISDSPIELDL